MKARIKETGEIVDLAQEVIGHKGERFQWFQLKLIPEPYDEFFDWQSFRAEAAKDILCAVINREGSFTRNGQVVVSHQDFIEMAVEDADALIAKLKEKEEK